MKYLAALIPCPDGTRADPTVGCSMVPSGLINPQSDIASWILKIASGLSVVVGIAAIVAVTWSGIQYAIAQGDEEKIEKAKRTLIWSLFGLVLSLIAYSVVQWVEKLL